jgi:hypothetical protein
VLIPRDPRDVDGIRITLQQLLPSTDDLYESKTIELVTIFFFILTFTYDEADAIRNHAQVQDVYTPKRMVEATVAGHGDSAGEGHIERVENTDSNAPNVMAILSWPPNTGLAPEWGDYNYDSSAGEGTYVYSCDYGAAPSHTEFSEILSFAPLFPGPFPVRDFMENDKHRHGTGCLSKAVGKTVGIARKARVVATVFDYNTRIYEHYLDALARIHQDIYVKGRGPKTVVNLSISIPAGDISDTFQDRMGKSTMWLDYTSVYGVD